MRPLDVGVIGCGTAGSAAAVFLARQGHRVTVYERVPSPGPVGAGITIQPTGLHVLCKLGLYNHVVSRGARIDKLLCERPAGKKKDGSKGRREVISLSYEEVGEGLFGLGVHRGVLFEALLAAVRVEPNISLRTGIEIVDLVRAEPRPNDVRARSTFFVDVDRNRHGPHDLVVVADGARSQLRDDTGTSHRIERYPWGALWFVGLEQREKKDPRTRLLHQIVDGNQHMLGILPTGRGPISQESSLAPSQPLVSLFWSIHGDRVAAWRKRGIEKWKEEVLELAPEAAPILKQIYDENQLLFAAYHDVVMHRWTTRNVVYLGDAAHATSPQLGQGCNLALWDAMELGECIAVEERDLTSALDRYTRRRSDHLAYYQLATRWLTPFFQGDAAWLGDLRDVVMPLFCKLSPFRRLMTLSMLGVMEGFTGDTLVLQLPRPE
jgi:2-polyprenyl-6-methoxyphenol hydroxylase-like FAD-dependent oxidoreductase